MRDLLEILSQSADGAYAVDSEQRIVMWNRGAEELLGYSAEEVLGQSCWELLRSRDEEGRAICRRGCYTISASSRGEPVRNYDARTRTKDGQVLWMNVSIVRVSDEEGKLWSVVHLFHDVGDRKRAEILADRVLAVAEAARRETNQRPAMAQPEDARRDLTDRETEVLGLLARGADTETIAEDLRIARSTVRNHIQSILGKLGVHSRVEAVAYAYEHDLI